METLVLQDRIFPILGGFWRVPIFDEFWGRKKVGPKSDKCGILAALGALPRNFWAGRRVGRRSWEGLFARFYKFWAQVLQELFDTPSTTV